MNTRFSARQLAIAGLLVAMSIVLSNMVSIPIGQTHKLSISPVPIFLSGLWLGPVLGGLCGAVADILGCLIFGKTMIPFITVSYILWGSLPAIFIPKVKKITGTVPAVFFVLAVTMLITSLGFTTLGLSLFYGTPFPALFVSRIPQTLLMWVADSLLVCLLYTKVHPSQFLR